MTRELSYQQVMERLPGFIQGKLVPEDMLAVENYIKMQQELLARLNEDEATIWLARNAPLVALPAHIKPRLMERIHAMQASAHHSTPIARHGSPRGAVSTTRLARLFEPSRGALAVAAAIVTLALLTPFLFHLQGQARSGDARLADLQATVTALSETNDSLTRQIQQDEQVLAFLARADHAISLPGTDEAPEASGALYLDEREALLLVHGLAPLPKGQTYELWVIPAGEPPIPAGLFALSSPAPATAHLTLPAGIELAPGTSLGLSIEPAGGNPAPTGPILLFATLAPGV